MKHLLTTTLARVRSSRASGRHWVSVALLCCIPVLGAWAQSDRTSKSSYAIEEERRLAIQKKLDGLPRTPQTLQAMKQDAQQRFLEHIQRAQNVEAKKFYKPFWKIDEKANHDYCESVAAALFKDRNRLSFPGTPTFSYLTNIREEILQADRKRFANCPNRAKDIGQSWKDPKDTRGLKDNWDDLWNREQYIGENYDIEVSITPKPGPGLRGDVRTAYAAGNPCPEKFYDSDQVNGSAWSFDMSHVLALVDGEFTVFQFGVYDDTTNSLASFKTPEEKRKWSEMFGRPINKGFIFVDGLTHDRYHSWRLEDADHVADPRYLVGALMLGHAFRPYEDGDHLRACVINFDLK